ncbi:hypothetical protein P9112_012818 [Eukaryota sp. TZLM1-RC]
MPNLLSPEPPKKRRVTLLHYYQPASQLVEVIDIGSKQSDLKNLPSQEQSQGQEVLRAASAPNSFKSFSAVRPPNYQKLSPEDQFSMLFSMQESRHSLRHFKRFNPQWKHVPKSSVATWKQRFFKIKSDLSRHNYSGDQLEKTVENTVLFYSKTWPTDIVT